VYIMRGHGWDGRGGPFFGGRRGAGDPPPPTDDASAFIQGALPDDWFTGPADVSIDRDEIIITGTLPAPKLDENASDADRSAAEQGRIAAFREATRERRVQVARQLEHRYKRKVAWGAAAGGTRELFTTHSAPVMTRLRQAERQVLDTLVDAGVARSRSEALAWSVRLVGQHAEAWLAELRDAMGAVDELRKRGPEV
jgi:Arc/MetJ-type ribon-helix-helix transcriptional regulator